MAKTIWQENAEYVRDTYGAPVDWDERFYICPYCGEPIYSGDWEEIELVEFICPICEDADRED